MSADTTPEAKPASDGPKALTDPQRKAFSAKLTSLEDKKGDPSPYE